MTDTICDTLKLLGQINVSINCMISNHTIVFYAMVTDIVLENMGQNLEFGILG